MPVFPRISTPFRFSSPPLYSHVHSPFFANNLEEMGMYLDEQALINKLLGPQPVIPPRVFTLYELETYYNGQNGSPSYVSANGVVFDISNSPAWATGAHFSLTPGHDYSTQFTVYHGNDILEISTRVPIMGSIVYV